MSEESDLLGYGSRSIVDVLAPKMDRGSPKWIIFNRDYIVTMPHLSHAIVDGYEENAEEESVQHHQTLTGMITIVDTCPTEEAVRSKIYGRPLFNGEEDMQHRMHDKYERNATINQLVELHYLDGYMEFRDREQVKEIHGIVSQYLDGVGVDTIHSTTPMPEEDFDKLTKYKNDLERFLETDEEWAELFGIVLRDTIGKRIAQEDTVVIKEEEKFKPDVVRTKNIDGVNVEIVADTNAYLHAYLGE